MFEYYSDIEYRLSNIILLVNNIKGYFDKITVDCIDIRKNSADRLLRIFDNNIYINLKCEQEITIDELRDGDFDNIKNLDNLYFYIENISKFLVRSNIFNHNIIVPKDFTSDYDHTFDDYYQTIKHCYIYLDSNRDFEFYQNNFKLANNNQKKIIKTFYKSTKLKRCS